MIINTVKTINQIPNGPKVNRITIMKNYREDTPKVFLTDYASYNEGTQFEFGHWVDLTDFSDADEFLEYCREHFEKADKKRPLDNYGSKREEMMITDFENFPRELYAESGINWEELFEYINLEDDKKRAVCFLVENNSYSVSEAMEKAEDVRIYEDTNAMKYELFEMWYPEAEKASESNPYLTIDYDHFIDENYTRWEYEGEHYLVEDFHG